MKHATRMRRIAASQRKPPKRRGLPGQRRRRFCERGARSAAVACARFLVRRGRTIPQAAACLGVAARTLYRWDNGWREDRLRLRARGRPIKSMVSALRREVFAVLDELGGDVGVPTLRRLFPDAGKRELEELINRYHHATRRDRRVTIRALRWTRPGSVWAMDFSEPPQKIDGIYNQIFCVRDLASENELWALPTIGKHAKTVVDSLEALARWHGPPLVLKLDNDGVFKSRRLAHWARRRNVRLLFSPTYTPEYNGSVESGMHTLKVKAHIASARHDRPGEWTCDDIQEAKMQMNHQGRPRGADGPTPDELWESKITVTDLERRRFGAVYKRHYKETCRDLGVDPAVQWQHDQRAALDRAALAGTVTELGFLLVRRRRISLPVSRRHRDKIS